MAILLPSNSTPIWLRCFCWKESKWKAAGEALTNKTAASREECGLTATAGC